MSIGAQLIALRWGGTGDDLSAREGPIHGTAQPPPDAIPLVGEPDR